MAEGRDPSREIINEANRAQLLDLGPVQPILNFKQSEIGKKLFRFQSKWYTEFKWLEYSSSKDAAFCFYCRCFGSLGEFIVPFLSASTYQGSIEKLKNK